MTAKDFFSFKGKMGFLWNLIAMGVTVCAIALGVLKGLDRYTRHGEAVVVPDVKGMPFEKAKAALLKQGLSCVVSDSSYVKNKPASTILELILLLGKR